jgi:hypothetical protein
MSYPPSGTMSYPPSGRIKGTKKKSRRDVGDIVLDAVESPFTALDDIFISLGNLFDDDDLKSDGTSGIHHDMEKLRADLHKMKDDLRNGQTERKESMHNEASTFASGGNATFSIGNTGKNHKHYIKLKDAEDNITEVTFNNPSDLSIRTDGDINPALVKEIKHHIRQQLKEKDPINVLHTTETYHVEEPVHAPRHTGFWSRTWRGERKEPIDIPSDAHVTVSGPSMLNRKYNVEVDGTTIYIRKIEEMIENCHRRGDLDTFVNGWTDDEKAMMLKVFNGLEALEIIECHHEAARKLISPVTR